MAMIAVSRYYNIKKKLKLIYKNIELEIFNKYKKEFIKIFIFKVLTLIFNTYINY